MSESAANVWTQGGAPAPPSPVDDRVLILAPLANDARLTAEFLIQAGLIAEICPTPDDLARKIREGCGALLLAEEVLDPAVVDMLVRTFRGQPSWSDTPITLVSSKGGGRPLASPHLRELRAVATIALVERPFQPDTLVSMLTAALRSRARQYQVRDLVADLRGSEARFKANERELIQARDEAVAASRAKDDFLAALSHELRTPLNPVLLLASEGAGDPALPDQVRSDFSTIARSVNLEARLIDDLLDLTRISRGQLRMHRQPHALHAVLEDAVETVQPEFDAKNIRVVWRRARGEPAVLGDAVRLRQIFWNVLKNAAKFTPAGGTVTVETAWSDSGRSARVAIVDTGMGMNADEIRRIFDPFTQGDHGAKQPHVFGGLGLGLAIARRLVELQGGTIAAASGGPDRGATFTIELPLAARPVAEPKPGAARLASPSPLAEVRHILLVDDHEASRTTLASLLRRRNFRVSPAGTIEEAVRLAGQGDVDLVVSDIGLPDGTGYDLMRRLSSDYLLRGIAVTGYGMEKDVESSTQAGFVAHLTKPIRVEDLDAALKTALAA